MRIETDNWEIDLLAHDHMDMVCAFSCSSEYGENAGIDDYIHNKALHDRDAVTYLVIDTKKEELVAVFGLSCAAILVSESEKNMLLPAVELKIFALDLKYQHKTLEDEQGELGTIGDVILSVALELIRRGTSITFGASRVVLYAGSDESAHFYERNGFKRFEDKMRRNDKPFVKGCIPMYYVMA